MRSKGCLGKLLPLLFGLVWSNRITDHQPTLQNLAEADVSNLEDRLFAEAELADLEEKFADLQEKSGDLRKKISDLRKTVVTVGALDEKQKHSVLTACWRASIWMLNSFWRAIAELFWRAPGRLVRSLRSAPVEDANVKDVQSDAVSMDARIALQQPPTNFPDVDLADLEKKFYDLEEKSASLRNKIATLRKKSDSDGSSTWSQERPDVSKSAGNSGRKQGASGSLFAAGGTPPTSKATRQQGRKKEEAGKAGEKVESANQNPSGRGRGQRGKRDKEKED